MKQFDATLLKSLDEFMESYKMVDVEQIYSNGTEFVPIFRVKQWCEYNNINKLQSNWNSLRECIEKEFYVVAKSPVGSFYDGYDTCLEEMKKDILDKMNELEGKK